MHTLSKIYVDVLLFPLVVSLMLAAIASSR